MAKYNAKNSRFLKSDKYQPVNKSDNKIIDWVKGFINSIILKIKDSKFFGSRKLNLPILKKYKINTNIFNDLINRIIDISRTIFFKVKGSKIAILGISSGLIIAFIVIIIIDFYNVKAIANFNPNVTTKIYDKNGIVIAELFRQKRDVVPLEKIPKNLVKAFIAIEDNDFKDHWGINIKGIVRAFFINIFSGKIKQGGSTITQQLSKVLLTSGKRNIFRKIKEAIIAVMMEFTYSKDEIMGLYLNQIFFGHGTYGVEAAADIYFNKHVWELNLAECSLLATLPSAPNRLSPIRHPRRSWQRHRVVLAKMVEMGFITVKEAEKAYMDFWPNYLEYISEIAPTLNTASSRINKAPWFTEFIRRKLVEKYGEEMIYDKGLFVYTTLDINKQIAAQEILKKGLWRQTKESSKLIFKNDDYIIDNYSDTISIFSELFDIPYFRKKGSRANEKINNHFRDQIVEELEGINYLTGLDSIGDFLDRYKKSYFDDKDLQTVEGCLISIDHRNGYIEALVGGSEFTSINQLNRVMQSKRQPGSAIKPLLYAAAMESGKFTPATAVLDSPIVYLDNEGGDWLPENYEGEYYGLVRLRKALALSINVVSIRIADALGIEYVMKYYSKLLKFDKKTAKERIPRNFSIALGSLEVTPFELTRAYAIIANGGKDVIPFSIRYIKDRNGKVLENREEEVKKILQEEEKNGSINILKPETAQVMISILRGVIEGGTGGGASPGRPSGGKTGTTNNWKDAWFVGFVPQLTTGMWIGYDKLGLSLGIGQSGGGVAAPIWGQYMREAMKHEAVIDFPVYAGLVEQEVCKRTGLLPSTDCKHVIKEYFIPGTVSDKVCDSCAGVIDHIDDTIKGPKENISKRQKRSAIKNLDKGLGDSLINDIGDDLLKKE